jgi:hypothetical protein
VLSGGCARRASPITYSQARQFFINQNEIGARR